MDYRPLYENAIFIAPSSEKGFFDAYRQAFPTSSFDTLTIEEVEAMFFYSYDDEALGLLLQKGYSYPLAKELLKGLCHMKDKKTYRSKKLQDLYPLFIELKEKGLFYQDAYPFQFFKGRNIVIRGYSDGKRIASALESLPNISLSWDKNPVQRDDLPPFYAFNDIHEELHALCNEIAAKLASNVAPEDVIIIGFPEECIYEMRRLTAYYHIPFAPRRTASLFELPFAKEVFAKLEEMDASSILQEAMERTWGEDELAVLSKLRFLADLGLPKPQLRSTLEDILKEERVKTKSQGGITLSSNRYFPMGSHVFVMDFSFGKAPKLSRDNAYFTDAEKSELGIATSLEINVRDEKELAALLRREEVEWVSYGASRLGSPVYPSPWAGDNEHTRLAKYEYEEERSKEFARFVYASLEDDYERVRKESPYRHFLGMTVPKEERYDPQFKPFPEAGKKGPLRLSFSGIDSYFKCPFSYYLRHVLHLKETPSSGADLGTLLHKAVESVEVKPIDKEAIFEQAKQAVLGDRVLSEKETFFLNHAKRRFFATIDFLQAHYQEMDHPVFLHEKEVNLDFAKDIALTGKIDLALFTGSHPAYVSILDFKANGKKYDETKTEFGLELQLPIYAYFATHDKEFKDHPLLGVYFVPLLGKSDPASPSYVKDLVLQGRYEAVPGQQSFDPNGVTSGFINKKAATPVENKGELGEALSNLAKAQIEVAAEKIRNGDFEIAPIALGQMTGCTYCPYADVCYRRDDMFRYEEGGDDNETDA